MHYSPRTTSKLSNGYAFCYGHRTGGSWRFQRAGTAAAHWRERIGMSEKTDILQSVDAALAVLMEVAKVADARLSEIARSLGETKPRTLRMLRTLEHPGLVQKTSEGGYRLGNAVLVLGTADRKRVPHATRPSAPGDPGGPPTLKKKNTTP